VRTGDELTLAPTELVAGGDALARVDGLPVFTPGIYPGDVALVRLTEVKKGYARGELVRVVQPSALRRAAPCPIAGECGGCDWTALRLDHQLEAKKRILVESLRRIGKFDTATLPPITLHPSPLNYRLRSRLHRDPATGAAGFFALRSHRVVPLAAECEVVGVETAKRMSRVAELGDESVELWETGAGLVADDRELSIAVDRYTFHLSARAFFQVNRHLLATLIRLVRAHATWVIERRTAIDLYAGVGFFTAPLAELFEHVTAVEGSPISARFARRNTPPNVRIMEQAVETTTLEEADLIFLDPPRAGARAGVIDLVSQKAREMICYLSCDPVTFSRDAKRLTASGWQLSTLDILDLFPNTHHVETLSALTRAG
jgi:23S rRNA (uracil1939-C5)-methyltransferase